MNWETLKEKIEARGNGISPVHTIINETCEEICDNFCKYRPTSDENGECDYIRDGQHKCPLDNIYT